MNEREKLEELINQAIDTYATMPLVNGCRPELKYFLADHLLANGVVVVDTNIVIPKNRPLISQCMGRPLDEIIELVHAKDEGRIVVPPCKVGDVVYSLAKDINSQIFEGVVYEITQRREENYFRFTRVGFYGGACSFEDFGKTVFLSRDLAEAALRERKRK